MAPNIAVELVEFFKETVPLKILLEVLEIPRSTFYRWKKSYNTILNGLTDIEREINRLCREHNYRLGYRKITALMNRSLKICRNTVQKIMQKYGWNCRVKSKRNSHHPGAQHPAASNRLNRIFRAKRPFEKLVTDITYLPKGLYLSSIMDLYDRSIIAYTIGATQNLSFVLDTLSQLPEQVENCLLHSDQGSVYTSAGYQNAVKGKSITMSMSRKGTPADNAPIECFHSQLKSETFYLNTELESSKEIVSQTVIEYITYYNEFRIQEQLGYLSPNEFRRAAA